MSKRKYTRWSRRIERNILACYHSATSDERTEGMHWYQIARAHCATLAKRHGHTVEAVAGVVAALSPGNQWGRNLEDTETILGAWRAGKDSARLPSVGAYGRRNVVKSARILAGETPLDVLGGDKVRAFYTCMAHWETADDVVIDRHAKCLALGLRSARKGAASPEASALVRPAEYRYLTWHYARIAARFDLQPHQLQAITWVTWKRLGASDTEEVPF